MPQKAKPYEQFGPYILFKKLESDALGELWRAAQIESDHVGPLVALRRFTGGHRTALLQSVTEARSIAPLLNGTSFVKHQMIDAIDAIPFVAFDYAGGRSLRHIVDRARGGSGVAPNPVPLDQAVLMASRIALSLATTSEMRYGSERLLHGGLIPQLVWVTDDGEVRVAGQHLGKGLVTSLQEPKVSSEIGRYFSPEYQSSGTPSKSSEVYAVGAILFLLVTGLEPPDPLSVSAFAATVRAAKAMSGQPIPLEIRSILDKSLILDPASRYASVTDMKQALDTVAAKYSATTFNLAFYVSTLLKKELESEVAERQKESTVSVAAFTAAPAAAAIAATPSAAPRQAPTTAEEPPKRRAGLFIAAGVAVVAIAGGAVFYMTQKHAPSPAAAPVAATTAPAPAPKPTQILQPPVLASTVPTNALPAVATVAPDPNAAKRAFEDAVNQKLQAEMLKLQSNFNKELQQKKSKNAPVVTEAPPPVQVAQARPAPAPVVEERAPSAAALDERRLAARTEPAPQPQAVTPASQVVQPQPMAAAAPAAAPQPVVREGDVVDVMTLDNPIRPVRQPVVAYPPLALRNRIETSVIVTALVSEDGDVLEVRVLRGDPRFGFNDAAMRALRTMKFTPPVKDGKRVKTWFPQTINFKL